MKKTPAARTTLAVLLLFASPMAFSAPRAMQEIGLRTTFNTSADPLSTEKVWTLDPIELNPHRQRWVIERDVNLTGLRPTELGAGKFGIEAGELRASTVLYIRPAGPWYRPMTEFHCGTEPDSWFATEEGTRVAGKAAAEAWEAVLGARKLRLTLMLERVKASTADNAMVKANMLFDIWLNEAETEWATSGRAKARREEWKYYLAYAKSGIGTKCIPSELPGPRWEGMMEPLAGEAPTAFLTRAPAKRWNGLFSARLSINVGDKVLNGQFLIDSGAPVSLISPAFFEAQGVNPVLMQTLGVPPRRVNWAGASGLAPRAFVFDVSMSGYPIPMNDFYMLDTSLFEPPTHFASCCDGVLGADFLHLFAVEFLPGPPAEIKLWPRQRFHQGTNSTWVEVMSQPDGDQVSACSLSSVHGIQGVRWDTGNELGIEIHQPWRAEARKSHEPATLVCGAEEIARGVPLSTTETPRDEEAGEYLKEKNPGATVGLNLLGRGNFTFDLPHGRIWFVDPPLLTPVRVNHTGLTLEFILNRKGDRDLRVIKIQPGTPAENLRKAGLKPEDRVLELDGLNVEKLDEWEVNRRLAGYLGDHVKLKWQGAKGGEKLGTLKTR